MANKKSLVLVTVDCLRSDHVGFMGYTRPTTPFLDSIASESLVFPAAIVAGAPTYYSFPAIHASRYPMALGRDVLGLGTQETTLASALQGFGYKTAAFTAANPYISSRFGYDQGFETFRDFLAGELAPLTSDADTLATAGRLSGLNRQLNRLTHYMKPLGRAYDHLYFEYCQRWGSAPAPSLDALRRFPAADVIVQHALEWLPSAEDGPFFLWLHLMDPHSPYYPTEAALSAMGIADMSPFRARYLNSAWNRGDLAPREFLQYREDMVSLYDAGVRWVDTQVARLVQGLRESGHWQNCVFALTADHGEEFLDHGGRYHPPSRLMEELIHVPMLVRASGVAKRELTNSPFSQMHLAPTLLDALQLPVPVDFRGRSLWRQIQAGASWDLPAIAESVAGCTNPFRAENRVGTRVLVVRGARYKLQLQFDPPAEDLFDLFDDPEERHPLPAVAKKPVRRLLLEQARAHLHRSAKERDLDLQLRTRLRELQLEFSSVPRQAVAP